MLLQALQKRTCRLGRVARNLCHVRYASHRLHMHPLQAVGVNGIQRVTLVGHQYLPLETAGGYSSRGERRIEPYRVDQRRRISMTPRKIHQKLELYRS